MKFLSNIDLVKNQLLNAAVHNSASDPTSPVEGQIYYNTTSKKFFFYNGTQWQDAAAADLSGYVAKAAYNAYSILMATADDTPTALTVGEQTVVGRATGGAITALSIISDLTAVIANHDSLPSAKEVKSALGGKQATLTFGIADTNAVRMDGTTGADNSFARFTANGIEGRTASEVLSDIGAIAASYLDTDITLAANSDVKIATQKAIKAYTDGLISTANAMVYRGVLACAANPNYPAGDAGHVYIVSTAGRVGGASGVVVDVGDMLVCNTDSTTTGDQAAKGAYWNIIEKNVVGAVAGPASSTDGNVALFDQTTGKIIKDSGYSIAQLQAIADGAVTLAKMANLPTLTIIGNDTGGSAVPKALTVAEVKTMLGYIKKASANIGDGVAKDFAVQHNLGSRDVTVNVYQASSPYEGVQVDFEMTDTNTVTLHFAAIPTSNQYRIVVTA